MKINLYRALAIGAIPLLPAVASASIIVAPHGSGRSADLAGVNVAAPDDSSSALVINPAGVVSEARNQALIAVQPGTVTVSYHNPASGYKGSGSKEYVALDLWYGLGEYHDWSMGVGLYGAVGAAFDLPNEPAIGQTTGYLGQLAQLNVGLNIGRELAPGLKFAIQLAPSYVSQKAKNPSPLGEVEIDAEGFGFSLGAGTVYQLNKQWRLGLAYHSKGKADLDGDAKVGGNAEDVSVDFVTPQNVSAGIAWTPSPRLNLMANARWTDYQDFEEGNVKFENTRLFNGPLIAKTHNRSRWGVAVEYQVRPNSWLRAGYTQGKAMIDDSAVKPNMFDHDNKMIMLGYEIDYGDLMLGFTTGVLSQKARHIDSTDNPFFPGRYETGDAFFSVGARATWTLR